MISSNPTYGCRDRHNHQPPRAHRQPDELTVLMELRLAFGPGTRLWAQRSREDLCYDWLRFKARDTGPDFHRFALSMYSGEAADSPGRRDLLAIRRRVASVLRNYRIKRQPASGGTWNPTQRPARTNGVGAGPINGVAGRSLTPRADVPLTPPSLGIHGVLPVETNKAPR